MANQKTKIGYAGNDEFTERQWFQKGYLLNEGAKGNERYTNSSHQKTAQYYTADEVHEGGEEWKAIKKERAHEAYLRKKKQEELWKEREEYREHMNTKHQWLFDIGRIPNSDANWRSGEEMNRFHDTCSYGSSYYYCHERDTHEPKDANELAIARWKYYYNEKQYLDYTDEQILEDINEKPDDIKAIYFSKTEE